MRVVVSRFIASLLVVLVVAPFTAPFPTCDPGALFGQNVGRTSKIPAVPPVAVSFARFTVRRARNEGEPASPVRVTTDAAVPAVPYMLTTRHTRGLLLVRAATVASVSTSLPSASLQSVSQRRQSAGGATLSVIRV